MLGDPGPKKLRLSPWRQNLHTIKVREGNGVWGLGPAKVNKVNEKRIWETYCRKVTLVSTCFFILCCWPYYRPFRRYFCAVTHIRTYFCIFVMHVIQCMHFPHLSILIPSILASLALTFAARLGGKGTPPFLEALLHFLFLTDSLTR
jgi:hypothetical protein